MCIALLPWDKEMDSDQTRIYYMGLKAGVKMYAHWKDGVQYVGTTGKTLNEAIYAIQQEEEEAIRIRQEREKKV